MYEEEFDIDEVLFDMFPNATTEEELQDELDCIWNDQKFIVRNIIKQKGKI